MPWNPDQYNRFEALRRRPAHDLVAALPDRAPSTVVDLGCGTGQLARQLAERWPDAAVTGVDGSPEMLAKAAAVPSPVRWVEADLNVWRPPAGTDLVVSNAALHWLTGHETLFPALMRAVAPGGVLAVQMPRNFGAPSHQALYATAAEEPWAARMTGVLRDSPVHAPAVYHGWLKPLAKRVDIWEVEYLQELEGEDAVLHWTRGTTLVPVMETLTGAELDAFIDSYRAKLAAAYPRQADGTTLYPFRRLFIIAQG